MVSFLLFFYVSTLLALGVLFRLLYLNRKSSTAWFFHLIFKPWFCLLLLTLPYTVWHFQILPRNWNISFFIVFLIELIPVLGITFSFALLRILGGENEVNKLTSKILSWIEWLFLLGRSAPDKEFYRWQIRWRYALLARKLKNGWQQGLIWKAARSQRWLWVLLLGLISASGLGWLISGQWLELPTHSQLADVLIGASDESTNSRGAWPLLAVLLSAPVAFVIWLYRDTNNLWQIENQRKDINLKDFQKLAEWVSGQHFLEKTVTEINKESGSGSDITKESSRTIVYNSPSTNPILPTPSRRRGSASLQIAAVFQLQAFLRGDFGRHFQQPAFALLTSIWLAVMQKHLNAVQIKEFSDHSSSNEKSFTKWCMDLKNTAHTPLMRALTQALAGERGKGLYTHASQLPSLCLAGLDTSLPSMQPLELDGIDMSGINMQCSNLSRSHFQRTTLSGAFLQEANLSETQLQDAVLIDAQLQGADLSAAHLQGANLVGVHLEGANLNWTELQSADMRDAYFDRADLSGAQLQNANMTDAKLSNAYLLLAQLQGANLSSALLFGTDLTMAKLEGATLANIEVNSDTSFLNATTDINTKVFVSSKNKVGDAVIDGVATHILRIKLRDNNSLKLPESAYTEYLREFNTAQLETLAMHGN